MLILLRTSLIGLALLVLASCAPSATPEEAEAPRLAPPAGKAAWSAEIHGVQVNYSMISEDSQQGELISQANGAGAMFSTSGGECNMYYLPKYFDAAPAGMEQANYKSQVGALITSVGYCLHEFMVAPSESEPSDQFEFATAWRDLYVERCGYVVHPLGWQNQDSTCEAPSPLEVKL